MRPEDRGRETEIEGVLVPVQWSASGKVSQVSLMTFDEAEYRVDQAVAEAHNLRGYLRKHIRILGRTRGGRVVQVTAVEFLGSSATFARLHPGLGEKS